MKNIYIILIFIFSFTIFSCAKKSDTSSTTTTTTELEGTWVVSCYASGSNYTKKTLIVSGSDVTEKWDYFSDSSCTSATDSWVATYQSLSIGDVYEQSSYGTSGGSGHKYTKTIITNTAEIKSSDEVSWYNNNSYCGLTGWELNVARDVAGKTCGSGDSAFDLWAKDITIYGLYILDGNKLFPNFTSGSYASTVSTVDSNKYIKQ